MGWSYTHFAKKSDIIKSLTERRTWDSRVGTKGGSEAVKKCVRGNVLYAVVRNFHVEGGTETETGRFLMVCLLGSSGGDWGYKYMDESMGPTEAKCPPAYFDLVGPPPNEWAKNWRERCRAYAAKMARKPVVGDVWHLPNCTPSLLTITSARPLRGANTRSAVVWGTTYRIPKRMLGERVWSPSWASDNVVLLLRGIVEDAAWERCPILADALQDGACEDEELLATLRGEDIKKARYLAHLMGTAARVADETAVAVLTA